MTPTPDASVALPLGRWRRPTGTGRTPVKQSRTTEAGKKSFRASLGSWPQQGHSRPFPNRALDHTQCHTGVWEEGGREGGTPPLHPPCSAPGLPHPLLLDVVLAGALPS